VTGVSGKRQWRGSVVNGSDGGQWYTAVTGSVVHGSDGGQWYTAVTGDSGIHYKPTNSLFQPHYTKQRNSKYTLQK